MDGSRRQPGPTSRYTAEQIAHIRDVYARWMAVRRERIRLTKTLGLGHSGFCRIGMGTLGKKPRD